MHYLTDLSLEEIKEKVSYWWQCSLWGQCPQPEPVRLPHACESILPEGYENYEELCEAVYDGHLQLAENVGLSPQNLLYAEGALALGATVLAAGGIAWACSRRGKKADDTVTHQADDAESARSNKARTKKVVRGTAQTSTQPAQPSAEQVLDSLAPMRKRSGSNGKSVSFAPDGEGEGRLESVKTIPARSKKSQDKKVIVEMAATVPVAMPVSVVPPSAVVRTQMSAEQRAAEYERAVEQARQQEEAENTRLLERSKAERLASVRSRVLAQRGGDTAAPMIPVFPMGSNGSVPKPSELKRNGGKLY